MDPFSFLEGLSERFDLVLIMLERPVVQRQLLAFALIALAAELLSQWLLVQRERRPAPDPEGARRQGLRLRRRLRRWLRAIEHTFSPVFAILLGELTVFAFRQMGWQVGLLRQGLIFFWLLLIYRLVVTILYALQSEGTARYYHSRLLSPLFTFVLLFALARAVSGIVDLESSRLFNVSERVISLGAVYRAAFIFYLFLVLAWVLQPALNRFLLPRLGADQGVSNTIRTVSRYVVLAAGILVSLASLGIDLSTLAIIGAGLSVGIGFGLQELVANFVSGILLLFEQSIRPGDVVRVNDQVGRVEKLRIRSTTVRTNENVELIVPNQSLLTSSVTTYTHSDKSVRVDIPVGVSYESEPQEIRQILLAAAGRHGLVNKNPPPVVFFEGYGDSSIDFTLAIWINDFLTMRRVTSDLRFIIWEELDKRGIEIPFPQRDLHLRSGVPWQELLAERKEVSPESGPGEEGNGAAPRKSRLPSGQTPSQPKE